ncbi:tetratricopeptide repeat protein [Oribacterium sp. FC2011]|uniref:tetratricopeptide repeat protein n=1 Tax=Oribacterium sp. FC2011 TaxID=1408311 RepID=UPI000679584C|nr:tetratricopeptide repeat protein [Oribacterium sp. FC2011]
MEKKSSQIIIIYIVTGILLVALIGMLVFFNLPAQRIKRMLKSANKYIAEENYDEAILTLQKMLEIDPKNEKLYLLLADAYEKNGDTDSKISLLQEAVEVLPDAVSLSETLNNKAVSAVEAGNGWKKAYINYITNLGNSYDGFGHAKYIYKLVNIDNDEIPELYINFESNAKGDAICTYYDGQLIEQKLSCYGLTYLEGQNIFRNQGGSMDEYFDEIYTLKNGQFILLHEGEYGAADNAQLVFDSDGNPIYNYYWDGTEVNSEEEYMSLLNSIYDTQQAISPYDGAYFDDTRMNYAGNGLCDYTEIFDAINTY